MAVDEPGIMYDLHSTMLLLYRWEYRRLFLSITIYIPLCFYFITATRKWKWSAQYIYIPLCFYFILWIWSIWSWERNLHSTMLLLYPVSLCRLCPHILDLHSTMLLLYPVTTPLSTFAYSFTFHYASTLSCRECPHAYFCNIYIPLCFYFIFNLRVICQKYHNLHSTMLLLYLKP